MKRERYRKKILLHMVLIVALSIFAVLFFLFSIKGLLLSEAEDNLLAYNQTQVTELDQGGTWKQNTNEFEGQIYSFLMDDSGNIVDAYGDRAKEIAKRNSNNLSIVLQDKETAAYRIQLQENNGLVEKHKLLSGESYYFAVHKCSPFKLLHLYVHTVHNSLFLFHNAGNNRLIFFHAF